MTEEKACRNCRYISMGAETCPVCGSSDLSDNWSGVIVIINPETSDLAKIIDAKVSGKYAVRIK
ncbi:MAG: transcription elongation factor subunit Spt4 [Candidatus Micrarchaeia archaeon]